MLNQRLATHCLKYLDVGHGVDVLEVEAVNSNIDLIALNYILNRYKFKSLFKIILL